MQASTNISWYQAAVPAIAGLVGVLVGGWITTRNQKIERHHRRVREQLEGFYSVLLGMRSQIRAKSEVRVKLRNIAQRIQQEEFRQAQDNPQLRQNLSIRGPELQKLIDYDDRQLQEELVPQYREMLAHVTKNMWLAEPSTLEHYRTLVEFVEVWNRGLDKSIPSEVGFQLDHDENKLYPFYEDVRFQFNRLQGELAEANVLSRLARWARASIGRFQKGKARNPGESAGGSQSEQSP